MIEEVGNNDPVTSGGNASSESFANIPSSTAEVKVRTMQSDLASLAATGGGMPQFSKVEVEGLSISKNAATDATEPKKNNKSALVILIVCVALVALGWFGYSVFFGKGSAGGRGVGQSNSNPTVETTVSETAAVVNYRSSTAPTSLSTTFTHVSLFRKPVDSTVTFSLPQGGATTANDLRTYNQQVATVLAAVDKNANFIEINAKRADGNNFSIQELLSEAGALIFDPDFLAAHFNPDATFFAYRDQNVFWPGYVLALRSGENQLAVKNSVKAIESSAKIGNIFFVGTGTTSPSGFADAVIAGMTVRVLNFLGAALTGTSTQQVVASASSTSFVYGWVFPGYLILSTSQNGFAQAVARLQ